MNMEILHMWKGSFTRLTKKKIKIKSSHADSLASIAQASSIIHGGEWDFNRVYSIEKFNSICFFPESSFLILRIIHNLNSFHRVIEFFILIIFKKIIIIVNLWLKKIWRYFSQNHTNTDNFFSGNVFQWKLFTARGLGFPEVPGHCFWKLSNFLLWQNSINLKCTGLVA